jgi:hypothetical protein
MVTLSRHKFTGEKYLNDPTLPAQIYWRKISKWSGYPGANILAQNI